MKGLQITLGVFALIVLSACSNYENFNKRKYTHGIFRTKSELKHGSTASQKTSEKPGFKQEELVADIQEHEDVQQKTRIEFTTENYADNAKDVDATEKFMTPVSSVVTATEENRVVTSLDKTGKKSEGKKKSKREVLSSEERNARASLILGIIGVSMVSIVILLVPFFTVPSSFLLFFGILRLSALFGILGIFKGTAFYRNPIEGKYENFRRRGVFLSILATAMWLVFLIF